jgi:starch synthase
MYTIFRKWQPHPSRQKSVILYFGRIEPYKGLEVLLRAFLAIQESLRTWKLVVAGIGDLPISFVKGAGKHIEIRNHYIPDPAVARLMDAASIVVLPYTSASQSGVVALAQAFRRPVIATDVGGMPEAIVQGKTGLLVPPGDEAKLARAIRTLALDPRLRAQMERNIATQGKLRWDPGQIACAHVRLYAQVLKQRRRK